MTNDPHIWPLKEFAGISLQLNIVWLALNTTSSVRRESSLIYNHVPLVDDFPL